MVVAVRAAGDRSDPRTHRGRPQTAGSVVSQPMQLNGPAMQVTAHCFRYGIPVSGWYRVEWNIRNAIVR